MAGRPRKPTPLHLIDGHGAKVAHRAAEGEPPAEPVVLECPPHLDDSQRKAWEYLSALAGEMRVTSKEDHAAMVTLACSWAALEELEDYLRDLRKNGGDGDGDVYTYETLTKDGSTMIRPRPQIAMVRELKREVITLLGRFGLTPSDRSKVRAANSGKPLGDKDLDSEFS